jgi:tetratricopeptide (TPR) repeat protein
MNARSGLLLAALLVRIASAQETADSRETPEAVAARVVAAFDAGDGAAMKSFAVRDEPDPWLTARVLCSSGRHDAAAAFARGSPRFDTRALSAYVDREAAHPSGDRTWDAVRRATAALGEGDAARALSALDLVGESGDVAHIEACWLRARAQAELGRTEDAIRDARGVAEAASRLGWHSRASSALFLAAELSEAAGDRHGAFTAWERLAEIDEALPRLDRAAKSLRDLASVHTKAEEHAAALECHERELRFRRKVGDRKAVGRTLHAMGKAAGSADDHRTALRHFDGALAIRDDLGDRKGLLESLQAAAWSRKRLKELPLALKIYTRALELAEQLKERSDAADILDWIGVVQDDMGEPEAALENLRRALAIHEELGEKEDCAWTLHRMAGIQEDGSDQDAALASYARELSIEEELGQEEDIASTLVWIARVHRNNGRPAEALAALERSLRIREKLGDPSEVADVLTRMGRIHRDQKETEKALAVLMRALRLHDELGEKGDAAWAHDEIALTHEACGELEQAADHFEKALAHYEEAGERSEVADSLDALVRVRRAQGRPADALALAMRAFSIHEELAESEEAGWTLDRVAGIHEDLGEFEKALECWRRVLDGELARGDRRGAASTLGRIGVVYQMIGDYPRAEEFQTRAVAAQVETGNVAEEAISLGNLALLRLLVGDAPGAVEFAEKSVARAVAGGHASDQAEALSMLCRAQADLGDYVAALRSCERALELLPQLGHARARWRLCQQAGTLYLDLGEGARGLEWLRRGLEIARRGGSKPEIAIALGDLGVAEFAAGDREAAIRLQEEALSLKTVADDRGITLVNLASMLNDAGRPEEALARAAEVLKGARDGARASCRMLALKESGEAHLRMGSIAAAIESYEGALNLARDASDPTTVVMCLDGLALCELKQGSPAKAAAHMRLALPLLSRVTGRLGDEQGARMRGHLGWAFDTALLAGLREGDPAGLLCFAESGRAGALLEALGGRSVLAEAVLPEHLVEAERTCRVALANAEVRLGRAIEAGARDAIRAAQQEVRAAEQRLTDATARIQREAKAGAALSNPEPAALEEVQRLLGARGALVSYVLSSDEAGALVVTARDARIVRLGPSQAIVDACGAMDRARLSELLVAPLGLGPDVGCALVCPDGLLASVPFSMLMPGLDLAFVPSATTLCILAGRPDARGEAVLALGDPDYGARRPTDAETIVMRGGALVALPETREEAMAVGDVVLLGGEATAARLASALSERTRWRAVHLACHGVVDTERPLFSSLALTGGRLASLDVFRLKVPADLVVLSACETARGKLYRAEGVMGFVRAFMFAGAPRVIVSLWSVDDEATKALMVRFYELWNPKDGSTGFPAATALRRAQEFVASQDQWKDPKFWAAWQLWGLPD